MYCEINEIKKTPTRHLSHPPIIQHNNTMDTEFLVQMRQSNKYGSVRNDETFDLHLASEHVLPPARHQLHLLITLTHTINKKKIKEPRN